MTKANVPMDQLVLIPLEPALCVIQYMIECICGLSQVSQSPTVFKNIGGAAATAEAAAWVAHGPPGSGFPPS